MTPLVIRGRGQVDDGQKRPGFQGVFRHEGGRLNQQGGAHHEEHVTSGGQVHGPPGFLSRHGLSKGDGVRFEITSAAAPGCFVAGQDHLFRLVPGDQGAAGHAPHPPGVAVQLDDPVFRDAGSMVQAVDVLGDHSREMAGLIKPGNA